MQNKQILGHDIIVGCTRAEYNFRRQKLSNFPLTSKYNSMDVLESLALRYSCFTPATLTEKGCFGNSIVFPSLPPTFFPRAPPLPLPDPPNHGKPPNLVLPRSGGPHTPPDLPSAPWNPQLPTHHFTGAASPAGLSTAPDLLDRHHGPPHRICLTGALVYHSVEP